jgi:hypothetical protein
MEQIDPIANLTQSLSTFENRVCSVAVGPNQVFVGTVGGEISVVSKSTGEKTTRSWIQNNTPIEGLMFDYEGKVIYGTEFNLVILDKNFKSKLKEITSYDPLRKISLKTASIDAFDWQEDDPDFGPQKSLLVGREELPFDC